MGNELKQETQELNVGKEGGITLQQDAEELLDDEDKRIARDYLANRLRELRRARRLVSKMEDELKDLRNSTIEQIVEKAEGEQGRPMRGL